MASHSDFSANLAGEQLGHAGFQVDTLAAVFFGGGVINQQTRCLNLGGHVGDFELNSLVLADRLSKGFALLDVSHRGVQGGLRYANGPSCYIDASGFQPAHHLAETNVFIPADEVLGRNAIIFEEQFAGVRAPVSQLVQVPPDFESVFETMLAFLDDECGQATVFDGGVGVGAG